MWVGCKHTHTNTNRRKNNGMWRTHNRHFYHALKSCIPHSLLVISKKKKKKQFHGQEEVFIVSKCFHHSFTISSLSKKLFWTLVGYSLNIVIIYYFLIIQIYNSACCLQIDSFYFTVPKSSGDRKRPDTSPVVARAAIHQRQQLQKANQALQVPAVALYPSRKKVPVKDLPPFGKTTSFWYLNTIRSSNIYLWLS